MTWGIDSGEIGNNLAIARLFLAGVHGASSNFGDEVLLLRSTLVHLLKYSYYFELFRRAHFDMR